MINKNLITDKIRIEIDKNTVVLLESMVIKEDGTIDVEFDFEKGKNSEKVENILQTLINDAINEYIDKNM